MKELSPIKSSFQKEKVVESAKQAIKGVGGLAPTLHQKLR